MVEAPGGLKGALNATCQRPRLVYFHHRPHRGSCAGRVPWRPKTPGVMVKTFAGTDTPDHRMPRSANWRDLTF